MSAQVRVVSGGLSTTVQDLGRTGRYAIGMPPSGAMDQYSFRVANLLVGNPEGAAALEATYIGPSLEFTDDRLVAVTGGDAAVTLNGEPIPMWSSAQVRSGDVLSFGMITSGARPYIAVSGGIAVPEYLGSRSTYTLIGLGGHEGRTLADGDVLPLGDGVTGEAGAVVPDELVPQFPSDIEVRAVVGLCSYRLTPAALESFLSTPWRITKDADRVGYRLRGGTLDFVEREQPFGAGSDPANVVDLGYPLGSIQVPGGDEPIVLLGDAVTGGGYVTIATVISVDRDLFGQAKTGDTIRFRDVGIDEALAARADRNRRLDRIRSALA
ncbi:biotin-dependent carboxyltransferase family protein [Janibacter sp. DB-40]|uniref:5-oxoprolinase subunit C family protein n=1 Tax=Janibacter sp. DB-40 TaxID=3028808 RepID=UPI00240690F8|nr:biotin-dependent carboxyltransferase family protein [Janibacter sp. DB-40]